VFAQRKALAVPKEYVDPTNLHTPPLVTLPVVLLVGTEAAQIQSFSAIALAVHTAISDFAGAVVTAATHLHALP
jgi:hypothetical protein